MQTFPEVIPLLADKIGATIPASARSHPLTQIEAGYTDSHSNTVHLLSHIYVSRSEALWKDPAILPWFERIVPSALATLDLPDAASLRGGAAAILSDLYDSSNVPLNVCRHVVCSESTSFLGFLPPKIRNAPVHSFDPLPPWTATSMYDDAYFAGLRTSQSRDPGGAFGGPMNAGFFRGLLDRIQRGMGQVPEEQREGLEQLRRAVAGLPDDGEVDLDAVSVAPCSSSAKELMVVRCGQQLLERRTRITSGCLVDFQSRTSDTAVSRQSRQTFLHHMAQQTRPVDLEALRKGYDRILRYKHCSWSCHRS